MQTIKKQFDVQTNLGYKNLIVSGCSFTYNNHPTVSCTWPFYLKDLGGFDNVIDLALPGAGNAHIANSIKWHLESEIYDINDLLVIVMWSGNDRDDEIISIDGINNYPMRFEFVPGVVSAISCGIDGSGNLKEDFFDLQKKAKSKQSRAIENYLYVVSLYQYLKSHNIKFVFLKWMDYSVPSLTKDFYIGSHLPISIKQKYDHMFAGIENIYKWCLRRDLLMPDDLHPSPDGHLEWTKKVLLPYLAANLNII